MVLTSLRNCLKNSDVFKAKAFNNIYKDWFYFLWRYHAHMQASNVVFAAQK
jgi:hypothetical protein